jgi:hypothetical protein
MQQHMRDISQLLIANIQRNVIMFKITSGKGFHLSFSNGHTISVQFGYGNYCDNYNVRKPNAEELTSSSDAEIMVWDSEGKNIPTLQKDGTIPDHGYVVGDCSPEYVAKVIAWVSQLPKA